MVPETLITTYLEMTSPHQFMPDFVDDERLTMMPILQTDVEFYLFLYREVGKHWRWRDRLIMPQEVLAEILAQPRISITVVYWEGVPAGYIELDNVDGNVEVAYFGLREGFTGKGLGKHLLSYGLARAWEMNANRIWVHTCNLDGPYALVNYQKRGFQIYEVIEQAMPERYL